MIGLNGRCWFSVRLTSYEKFLLGRLGKASHCRRIGRVECSGGRGRGFTIVCLLCEWSQWLFGCLRVDYAFQHGDDLNMNTNRTNAKLKTNDSLTSAVVGI